MKGTLSSDEREFVKLRDRARKAGHNITRIFSDGDPPHYIATCWGISRRFESIVQVEIFVDLVSGKIDAAVGAR